MRKKFGLGGGVLTLSGIKKAASKKIAKTAAERKDQLLNIIKKRKTRKLFGKSRLKQKTIKRDDRDWETIFFHYSYFINKSSGSCFIFS